MRIQVLHLPDEVVDGREVPRFALVLDEYQEGPEVPGLPTHHEAAATFRSFAQECGAKDGLVVDRRVEIVEDTASAEFFRDVVDELDKMIGRRLDEHVAARSETHHWHVTQPATITNGTFLQRWNEAQRRFRER